ncbi:4Fe-4S binding protein [uncultured Adlercreutzia sp.]|uniref:4Fe-4S binding protein n=1 Tax=uncultured Adlercreutzia sp. TaxID=875803 RepID=UPI0026760EC0|nr:4Fe-4S binding protein [uncultured Adlercreutzia sp.]
MKSDKLRLIAAGAILIVVAVGLVVGANVGTLSGFGFDSIALLCPVGALLSMVASHTLIPRAVLSLVVMAAVVLVVGRAFCAWVCPAPLLERLRGFFRTPAKRKQIADERAAQVRAVAEADLAAASAGTAPGAGAGAGMSPGAGAGCASCGACGKRPALDSRHVVLGGAVLSTAVFGFPVFCLVCPIGLTFATVLLVWRLFFAGDLTVAIVLAPVLLAVELVFLRKWCARICPISAIMNLVARGNRTFRPRINDAVCLETAKGVACSKCAEVCDFGINLRHPEAGELGLVDCTRCRACVDACPTHAVSLPFSARLGVKAGSEAPAAGDAIGAAGAAATAGEGTAAPIQASVADADLAEEAALAD